MNPLSESSLISSSTPVFELSSFAFFGRTLAEYARFFSIDPAILRGRSVLDVAAGPSSFAAEANHAGITAVAVDPLYGCPPATLAAHVQLDYARVLAQMRSKPGLLKFRSFASIADSEASRRSAAAGFLADYEDGFLQGRYRGGALPGLPFDDRSFDLVLCAHLLFIYQRILDYDFHLAACSDLVRVGRGEARIHPLCGPDGLPYAELSRLRRYLEKSGIASQVVAVDYEFFVGSDSMLVLSRIPQ